MAQWYSKVAAAEPVSRRRLAIAAAGGVVLVALIGAVWSNATSGSGTVPIESVSSSVHVNTSTPTLVVHVIGEVVDPGVYEVEPGSRVLDAVERAGGFTRRADSGSLNLARVVNDGEQILVGGRGASAPSVSSRANRININSATIAEWETLPRIGPTLAARIVNFRSEHGPFASVDALLDVPGIGTLTLDGMRDQLTG